MRRGPTMDGLFHALYSQFILRDFLAKIVPGSISLLAVTSLLFSDVRWIWHRMFHLPGIPFLLLLYGIIFMFALAGQFMGDRIGLIRIFVWQRGGDQGMDSVKRSLASAKSFMNENRENDLLLRQRERFVILKEMAANYGVCGLFVALALFGRSLAPGPPPRIISFFLMLITIAAAFFLFRLNRFYADEQLIWEGGEPESRNGGDSAGA
jgi:hypothetical protein